MDLITALCNILNINRIFVTVCQKGHWFIHPRMMSELTEGIPYHVRFLTASELATILLVPDLRVPVCRVLEFLPDQNDLGGN